MSAVLIANLPARAGLIHQEQAIADRKTDFHDDTTLTFAQFDTVGDAEVLHEVTIRVEQTLRTHVTIPKPPKGAVVSVQVGSEDNPLLLSTMLPFGLTLDDDGLSPTSVVTTLDPVTVSWAWTDQGAFTGDWNRTATYERTFTDLDTLALFTGAGSYSFDVLGDSWSHYSSTTGNGGALVLTHADVRVWVEYQSRTTPTTTSVVPEPASAILAALGLTTLCCFQARRRIRR